MNLNEKLEVVVEIMKETKEAWVAHEPENPDLAMYIHFFRGDDLVAVAQCPLDRDTALKAAGMAAPGFEASMLTMTFESYLSHLGKSPITGKPWIPREMQFVAETRTAEALEKGWVTECLTTSGHERGGMYGMHRQPYVIRDGKVDWGEALIMSSDDEDFTSAGYMFENLQAAISSPTITARMEEEAKSNQTLTLIHQLIPDPERRQFHLDMATAQALEDNQLAVGVMLMAEEGTNRQTWLSERLDEAGKE